MTIDTDTDMDHEMFDAVGDGGNVVQRMEGEEASGATNAGLSTQSATSKSSDLADESALQHLNVRPYFSIPSYPVFVLWLKSGVDGHRLMSLIRTRRLGI